MPIRTFSLNSPEACEALCPRRERPWIPNGALPSDPLRPRPSGGGPWVQAETDKAAGEAFGEWLGHVEAGRIGKGG